MVPVTHIVLSVFAILILSPFVSLRLRFKSFSLPCELLLTILPSIRDGRGVAISASIVSEQTGVVINQGVSIILSVIAVKVVLSLQISSSHIVVV